MGRQHQRMDRPGVRQVPEGSGEQGKMEKTGCKKIICGAQTTLEVKGLMMMMMMPISTQTNATHSCNSRHFKSVFNSAVDQYKLSQFPQLVTTN